MPCRRSRAPGDGEQYNTLEGKTKKRLINTAWSSREAFADLAPGLVEMGLEFLELEEVGFVDMDSVKDMRKRGFDDALFVTDEQVYDPLEHTLGKSTGGLLFHTLRRTPAHLLPLPSPPQQQQHQQPG